MKLFLFLFFISFSALTPGILPCEKEDFIIGCVGEFGDNTFLKSFTVSNQKIKNKKELEQSIPFSKGTNYIVRICTSGNQSDLIVTLYDRNHKLKASSYDPISKKYYPGFNYPCNVDGSYIISFSYDEKSVSSNSSSCGVIILGMKKI